MNTTICKINYISFILLCFIWNTIREVEAKRKFVKPRDIIVQELRMCPEYASLSSPLYATIRKYNRTAQIMNVNYTISEDFNDDFAIEVEARKWGDGGWKNNFFQIEKTKACSSIFNLLGDVIKRFMISAGRKPNCPIAKGNIFIKDMLIDGSGTPLIVGEGRFMLRFKVKDGKGDVTSCSETIMEIKKQI